MLYLESSASRRSTFGLAGIVQRLGHTVSRGRVWPDGRQWLLFVLQLLLVASIELGDDLLRGNLLRPNPALALQHAHQLVHLEAAHHLFWEPALQAFFQQPHPLFGLLLTWPVVVSITDTIYALCHLLVPLAVALWLFLDHRPQFALVRTITLLTTLVALLGYELYPLAPPRLTTGLTYQHHPFRFQDPMSHILGTGTLNGTPIGYNPFSAMPSLHVAWAVIMGMTVLLLARQPLLRLLGGLYPVIMTWTVVVTANHYLADAAGAVLVVCLATALALLLEWGRSALGLKTRSVNGPGSPVAPLRPVQQEEESAPLSA